MPQTDPAVQLEEVNISWQLVVEGRVGDSYLSDVAVGGVMLLQGEECHTPRVRRECELGQNGKTFVSKSLIKPVSVNGFA